MSINPSSMLIVCGETSSDEHMAPVLAFLKQKLPQTNFFGMGGAHLQEEGMELTVDARVSASVMGITEVLHKLGDIVKAFNLLLLEVDKRNTKIAVLVDFPDFNLRLAKKLKKRGITVVYFITPQLWAWRKGRINQVKSYVDTIIPIFPFEVPFYKSHGVEAQFVGHPFTDKSKPTIGKEDLCKKLNLSADSELLALLPGSRKAEIEKILPVLAEVAAKIAESNPQVKCVVPIAPSVEKYVNEVKASMPHISWIVGHARELLHVSRAAVVASGTATVEASLSKIPFCICYKVSPLTYTIGKILIRGVKFIGMPNLIAKKEIVKEFIQGRCSSKLISKEVIELLVNESYREQISRDLEKVNNELSTHASSSVSERVANEIITSFGKSKAHCPLLKNSQNDGSIDATSSNNHVSQNHKAA